MANIGTDKKLIKVRLIGESSITEPIAAKIVDLLEANGCLVMEWSRPFPCRLPEEEGKFRIYLSARKELDDGHVS